MGELGVGELGVEEFVAWIDVSERWGVRKFKFGGLEL